MQMVLRRQLRPSGRVYTGVSTQLHLEVFEEMEAPKKPTTQDPYIRIGGEAGKFTFKVCSLPSCSSHG